ncbi:MAG TPA: phenylalanine--tRNA ligase subunit alpha [Firmicutes bacterium]|nr:phenylalanine--tRNA ligase subunit alpha [Bacillota bacterium]
MREKLDKLRDELRSRIGVATELEELEKTRVQFLGKKGILTMLMRNIQELPVTEKPLMGKLLNELKQFAAGEIEEKKSQLLEKLRLQKQEAERIDVTLPGMRFNYGSRHPITLVLEEIEEIFTCMGFQIGEGPDVELDHYNFTALNMPPEHPARDMQDSFYTDKEMLLRTHTSPVQIRTMEKMAPALPVRIIAPGKVYRRDDDITHSPMFHQVEGLAVDRGISLADLKGTLLLFVREMFGRGREIRLRPSFFPFTEPSAEVDISCIICNGRGCRTCGNSGWLEILGAGLVHPYVLEVCGYDPEAVSGFAFGMGVERIAMLKYGIDDIRLFYINDLRMLRT